MYLVDAIRPRLLVELGAFSGSSYSILPVDQGKLSTKVYAVDTWAADDLPSVTASCAGWTTTFAL
jgi:hypothetical protein